MALRKRIPRILAENKGRFIGVFILIFLGAFSLVWFRGFSSEYTRLVSSFAEQNMQEDVSFTSQRAIEEIADIELKSGAIIDGYRYFDAKIPNERELRLMEACSRVNIPEVLSGRGLENPGEILLYPSFYDTHNYKSGDIIEIDDKVFTIVGTVALPHYIYPLKYVNDVMPAVGFGIGVISSEDMDRFVGTETVYTARFIDRANAKEQIKGLYNTLNEEGEPILEWVDSGTNKRIRMAWATISSMNAMSVPIPTAMFLLCCLIVGLMIWRMVRAENVIIGTLYAQGYRRSELTRHYLSIPLIISAAAGFVGVLLAIPSIGPVVKMMATLYYIVPYDGTDISWVDAIIGVLIPMAFLSLASLFVVRSELKKTSAELMKGDRQKSKVNALERTLKLERLSFSAKFKVREQLRSIPRLLFLLFGVMAASFLMLIGFTINHSMDAVFRGSMNEPLNYSWEYSFNRIKNGDTSDGILPFNSIRCYPEGREGAEFYLNGIPTDAPYVYNLVDAKGQELPKDQINISFLLANRLNLEVGDSLSVVDKLTGKTYTFAIDGIAQTYSGQFIYMPLADFNKMIGLPLDSYNAVFSKDAVNYDSSELSGVKDLRDLTDAMDDLAAPMTMMVVGLTIVAVVIGVVIIYLVTSLIIEENRASISLLKIFGYRKKEVVSLVLGGSGSIVVVGFLLSIPLMIFSANAMYSYLGEMINLVLPMILSPLYVSISFVLIYVIFELTKFISGRRLASVSMSDALKAVME